MTTQFRLYTIREGRLDAFLDAWRAVPPLRRVHGFSIDGAWVAREEHRFFWMVSHAGDREEFERAERTYYESPERKAMRPDPGHELAATDHLFVEAVESELAKP